MNGMTPFRRPGRCAAASRDLNAEAAPLPREAPDRVRGDAKMAPERQKKRPAEAARRAGT